MTRRLGWVGGVGSSSFFVLLAGWGCHFFSENRPKAPRWRPHLRTLVDHGGRHPTSGRQRQAHVGREVDFAVGLHVVAAVEAAAAAAAAAAVALGRSAKDARTRKSHSHSAGADVVRASSEGAGGGGGGGRRRRRARKRSVAKKTNLRRRCKTNARVCVCVCVRAWRTSRDGGGAASETLERLVVSRLDPYGAKPRQVSVGGGRRPAGARPERGGGGAAHHPSFRLVDWLASFPDVSTDQWSPG